MAKRDLWAVLGHLRSAGGGGLTDRELLDRFVAARDEAAFEALVHRHGPMVFGLCRRVLGNEHDAADAFQATFLVFARRGASVVRRDSVGSWLYAVAYRTAQALRGAIARRRARERQLDPVPHPEVPPAEPHDWLPILDREVARLPEKYRQAVVLYYLEGRGHREAALQLGVPEGTLSSRLVKARGLLARRLARYGPCLSAGAVATLLSEGTAAAAPAPLVAETVRAASLVAAGQLAAVSTPAALLTKGVLTSMFLTKLKLVAAVVMVAASLGVTGLAYRAAAADEPAPGKPPSEIDALRRENRLLKLNLEVVLEKVRAQEDELRALRGPQGARDDRLRRAQEALEVERQRAANKERLAEEWKKKAAAVQRERADAELLKALDEARMASDAERRKAAELLEHQNALKRKLTAPPSAEAEKLIEEALKALRGARDADGQRRAAEALEQALRRLKAQPPEKPK